MMNPIIYRCVQKEDYPQLKALINEAFGFDDFISNPKFLNDVLEIYLQECILSSTYSQVAVCEQKIIGIILGSAKSDSRSLRKIHNYRSYILTGLKLIFSTSENKQALKEYSKISTTYKEFLKGRNNQFGGCLQLFIVSKEARGLGLGKTLLARLLTYMKQLNVASFYLYTDTRCNYGFYDYHQFQRLETKQIYFKSDDMTLDVFLYGYTMQ